MTLVIFTCTRGPRCKLCCSRQRTQYQHFLTTESFFIWHDLGWPARLISLHTQASRACAVSGHVWQDAKPVTQHCADSINAYRETHYAFAARAFGERDEDCECTRSSPAPISFGSAVHHVHAHACVLTGDICACVSISKRSTRRTGCMMHTEPFLLDMQVYYAVCCADMRHGAPNSNRADVEAGCMLQAHPRAIERFHQLRISAGHVSRRMCFQWCHCTRCASCCWHGFILRKHSH